MNTVKLLETGLELTFPQATAYFNYFWLRDNCATSWDPVTQERTFDVLEEPDDLSAQHAEVVSGDLKLVWRDGHQSQFSLAWLERWSNGEYLPDIAVRTRVPWYSDHYSKMARFDYTDLVINPARVADWTESLLDEGVSIVQGLPDSNEGLKELCNLIGTVRASFSGHEFDVFSKADPENLAYTSKSLELHTDLPPEELPPGVQFLHCRINDAEGGDSLFVDAMAVANKLKAEFPEHFKLLTELRVPFRYTTKDHDVRSRQFIIEIDANNGEVSGVNFSQHLSGIFDFDQKVMDALYPAFRQFGRMMQDPKYLMKFRLHAGECIVFDNHRIAHGRAAYLEGSGDRYLRGCYVDRGELRSKYRVLRAKYPNGAE